MVLQKIKEKKTRIGVIGLGYVGLPLVIEFGKVGFSVIGLDTDQEKIELLSQGKSYINHIPDEEVVKPVGPGEMRIIFYNSTSW